MAESKETAERAERMALVEDRQIRLEESCAEQVEFAQKTAADLRRTTQLLARIEARQTEAERKLKAVDLAVFSVDPPGLLVWRRDIDKMIRLAWKAVGFFGLTTASGAVATVIFLYKILQALDGGAK